MTPLSLECYLRWPATPCCDLVGRSVQQTGQQPCPAALLPTANRSAPCLTCASLHCPCCSPRPAEPRHQKKRQRKQSKQQLLEAAQAKQATASELAGSADGKVRGPGPRGCGRWWCEAGAVICAAVRQRSWL